MSTDADEAITPSKIHMQARRALNKSRQPTANCRQPIAHSLDIHTPSHIAEMLRHVDLWTFRWTFGCFYGHGPH